MSDNDFAIFQKATGMHIAFPNVHGQPQLADLSLKGPHGNDIEALLTLQVVAAQCNRLSDEVRFNHISIKPDSVEIEIKMPSDEIPDTSHLYPLIDLAEKRGLKLEVRENLSALGTYTTHVEMDTSNYISPSPETDLTARLERHTLTLKMIKDGRTPPPIKVFSQNAPSPDALAIIEALRPSLDRLTELAVTQVPEELLPALKVSHAGKLVFHTGDNVLNDALNQEYQQIRSQGYSGLWLGPLLARSIALNAELLEFHGDEILNLYDEGAALPNDYIGFLGLKPEELNEDGQFLAELVHEMAGRNQHKPQGKGNFKVQDMRCAQEHGASRA